MLSSAAGGGGDFLPFSGMLDNKHEWPAKPDSLPLVDISLELTMKLRHEAAKFAPTYALGSVPEGAKEDIKPVTWHPVFLAQAVLAEFCTRHCDWHKTLEPPLKELAKKFESKGEVEKELKILVYLSMAERPRRLPEIVRQADDIRPYFYSLLGGNMVGKAASSALIETGLAVGLMVAMHFRYKFNRARPWQIYPPLLPPVTTPAHPSYPNGHALQSLIIAKSLALATHNALEQPALAMARRIGENREVAGVHFLSDRVASQKLAGPVMELLKKTPRFKEILFRAGEELGGMQGAGEKKA